MDDRAGKSRDHNGRERDDERRIGLNEPSKAAPAIVRMEDRNVDGACKEVTSQKPNGSIVIP